MSTPEQPWYADGLRFRCTRCGHCCTGDPGWVWIDDAEVQAIAEFRKETVEEVLAMYTKTAQDDRSLREKPNGDCVFFDREKGCVIYSVRPRQCRTWPFWESTLHSPETWEKTCKVCPGSGQGDLIPAEEITRRMKVIAI